MKTIYVTGATGILGANVCTQLMTKGYAVRASVRDMDNSDAIALRDAGVEVVPGDLKDRASLASAVEGADGVIHSGAMLGRPGASWDEGYATNVVGTMNLLCAAADAGNLPVVQVLTTTFFDSSRTLSEESALDLTCAFMDVYTVTKRLAYLEGMGRVREGQDIRFMVPGAIYGPSICVEKANWANTFNDRFIKAIKGEMPNQLPLPMPWSTADDCAWVCIAALENGEAGKRYVAHGSPDSTGTVATVMNRACQVAGVDHRIRDHAQAGSQIMKKHILFVATLLASVPAMAATGDGKFTIAAIPDTQNYMDYTHQKAENFPFDAREMFFEQMEYIAANVESQGGEIAFVTGLGDVWQHQTMRIDPDHYMRGFREAPNSVFAKMFAPSQKVLDVEMPAARKGYELLMGKVPFSAVPGNHDYDAMWTDSKFPPAEKLDPKDLSTIGVLHPGGLSNFRAVFGEHTPFFKDRDWYVGANDGGADSAQIFEAEGYRFLHIGLQFDPPNTSLEWAARMIEKYKGLPTIISTHDYLDTRGERRPNFLIDAHKVDPQDNSPQLVWDKLISQHDQIFMVLCGHHHGQSLRIDRNAAGNEVYQMLADYQDRGQTAIDAGVKGQRPPTIGDGWMRLMEFDFTGKAPVVRVRTYSTHYKKQSGEVRQYARWYRDHEDPGMSDKDFAREDDFSLTLTDFVKRFGERATVRNAAALP